MLEDQLHFYMLQSLMSDTATWAPTEMMLDNHTSLIALDKPRQESSKAPWVTSTQALMEFQLTEKNALDWLMVTIAFMPLKEESFPANQSQELVHSESVLIS